MEVDPRNRTGYTRRQSPRERRNSRSRFPGKRSSLFPECAVSRTPRGFSDTNTRRREVRLQHQSPLKARQKAEVIYEQDAEAMQAEQGRQRERSPDT